MRKFFRGALVAGVSIVAVASGAVGIVNERRVMTVDLPDGSLARIEYKGVVPPKIAIEPALQFVPVHADPDLLSPFSLFDQLAADIDLRAGAMLKQARLIEAAAIKGGTVDAAFGKLPAGTMSYHLVTMNMQNGSCIRSVEVTSFSPNQQPKVVSSSSGDCNEAPRTPTPTVAAPEKPSPHTKTV